MDTIAMYAVYFFLRDERGQGYLFSATIKTINPDPFDCSLIVANRRVGRRGSELDDIANAPIIKERSRRIRTTSVGVGDTRFEKHDA